MKDQESRETIGSKSLESHTNRRTTIIAICIVMMFVMVSLTYRLNLNAGEIDMEPTTEELDEWYVHFATSSSDLPECTSKRWMVVLCEYRRKFSSIHLMVGLSSILQVHQ